MDTPIDASAPGPSGPAAPLADATAKVAPRDRGRRRSWARVLVWALALLVAPLPDVEGVERGAGSAAPTAPAAVTVEVFVREGCQHCAQAEEFLAQVARERPGLAVVHRDVDLDAGAMDALIGHARRLGRTPAVPTFVIGEQVLVGFVSAQLSGPGLLALIDAARSGAQGGGTGPPAEPPGSAQAKRFGLAPFSVGMGVLDGVNACAMWALLFLLSMLVHLHDRRRIALLAGTFVAATVAIHAVLLSAWFDLAALVRLSSRLQVFAGVVGLAIGLVNVKDAIAPGRGPSLSVPASMRRDIGARVRAVLAARSRAAGLAAVVALAVVVNVVELLCTAGFPAMFAAVLARLVPDGAGAGGYMGLYMLGYSLPSVLLALGTVVLLTSPKLGSAAGRWLKLLSGVSILVLAATLLWPVVGWRS